VDSQQTATTHSVTCETHDEAVLQCLTALARFAERSGDSGASSPQGVTSAAVVAPGGWGREDGRVTYQFSDQRRRGIFLGEATRLLSGKWLRVDLSR
jgi:hypothetical protein